MMILILSICLGAAFSGYAEKATGDKVALTAVESFTEESGKYDLNHKPVALHSHSFSRRTLSTSHRHSNYSRFVDLFWTVLSPKPQKILLDFYQPQLYFKPIGLKLVFPEHYFW